MLVKILVADDEENIRTLYTMALEEEGYEIIEAVNGIEALQLYEQYHPDIIITDMHMPHMSGIEFIKAIREKDRSIKIISISSLIHQEADKEKLITEGADHCLAKPVSLNELIEVIKSCQ